MVTAELVLPIPIVVVLLVPRFKVPAPPVFMLTVLVPAACRDRLPELVVKLDAPAPIISTPLFLTSRNLAPAPLLWTVNRL